VLVISGIRTDADVDDKAKWDRSSSVTML